MLEDKGKIYKYKKEYTSGKYSGQTFQFCSLSIPSTISNDSQFPFVHKEKVRIRVEGKKIIVEAE